MKTPFIVKGKIKCTFLFEFLFAGPPNQINKVFFYQIMGLFGIQTNYVASSGVRAVNVEAVNESEA